jgi:Tat protein secretion system quality control protein TatD with DNase activity
VPPERILIETDYGYNDPPEAIPCRVEWVEHLMGQQLKMKQMDVRRLAWRATRTIIELTGIGHLLLAPFLRLAQAEASDAID